MAGRRGRAGGRHRRAAARLHRPGRPGRRRGVRHGLQDRLRLHQEGLRGRPGGGRDQGPAGRLLERGPPLPGGARQGRGRGHRLLLVHLRQGPVPAHRGHRRRGGRPAAGPDHGGRQPGPDGGRLPPGPGRGPGRDPQAAGLRQLRVLRLPPDLPDRPRPDPRAQEGGGRRRPPPAAGAAVIAQLPADADVRKRLREDFETTFFVEAGAGTGKTTTLVDRIVALVAAGKLTTAELVAITFTEAAAAELRARVREGLEKWGTAETATAAASLEEASIDTIHSFAGALLRTYPLEAGLPPNFDTLDQIEQDLEFRERFRSWFEAAALLDLPSISIKNALLLGLSPDRIEGVARALHEHYDLLDSGASWPAPPAREALPRAAELAEKLRGLERWREDCLDPTDRMYDRMGELAMSAERLAEADSEGKALNALLLLDGFPIRIGKKANWR
ncbi:MAG: hypothetical protein E6I85_14825, partial [Chloroflexi bacterium]